jgi:hypothetical protein
MRRLASTLALALTAAVIAAGCGGDDSGSNPLDGGLAYLPKKSVFAVSIDSNLSDGQYKALDKIVGRFPLGGQLKQQIVKSIEENGASFKNDVRPLLGNPIVVGTGRTKAFGNGGDSGDEFIAAVQVKDKDKLDELLKKEKAKEQGERSDAKLYKSDDTWLAVEGDMLVTAGSKAQLEGALDRRDKDDHLTEGDFDKGLEGLPKDALFRVYADVEALLNSDPDTADARRVKWVKALRTLGLTAQARDDALHVDFDLKTEGDLSESDLPLAPGDEAPGVLRNRGEVGIGLRDLAQVFQFGEATAQAVNPTEFGQYAAAKRQIEQRYKLNVDEDLIGQFTGDTSMGVSVNGKYGVRAELKDPAAFKKTLAKVADLIPTFAKGAGAGDVAIAKPKRGSDFYALADGKGNTIVFGVVDGVFVAANDPTRAGRLATEKPTSVPGAKGAFTMSADAEQLLRSVYTRAAPQLGLGGNFGIGLFIAPLKDLSASVSDSPDGMRGSFEVSLD